MASPVTEILIASDEGIVGVTDAILEAHSFRLETTDFPGAALPKLSCAGVVGTAIEVLLWENVAGVWEQVFEDGVEVILSATVPQVSLRSYGKYAVSKALATTGTITAVTKAR